MSIKLEAGLWGLPGAKRFVNETSTSLQTGISFGLLFPDGINQVSFLDELERSLDVQIFVIDLDQLSGDYPLSVLVKAFMIKGVSSWEEIVSNEGTPSVTIIKGLATCDSEIKKEWFFTPAYWGKAAHSQSSNRSICLITDIRSISDVNEIPRNDLRYRYKLWIGIPSALEMRLLCRYFHEDIEESDEAFIWRENLIPSLANEDIELAQKLWNKIFSSAEIFQTLKEYCEEKGWTKNGDTVSYGWKPVKKIINDESLTNIQNLTYLGLRKTSFTYEYGEEINTAFLYQLGKIEDVNHRIWRGESVLMLPLLDEVRLRICDLLKKSSNRKGLQNLKQNFNSPQEWSEIIWLLKNEKSYASFASRNLEKIDYCRSLRNKLAHYEPIEYQDMKKLIALNQYFLDESE